MKQWEREKVKWKRRTGAISSVDTCQFERWRRRGEREKKRDNSSSAAAAAAAAAEFTSYCDVIREGVRFLPASVTILQASQRSQSRESLETRSCFCARYLFLLSRRVGRERERERERKKESIEYNGVGRRSVGASEVTSLKLHLSSLRGSH